MRLSKIAIIAGMAFLALGGIGGVMLVGYTFILHAG
ncbi:protein YohO [Shimwellia pseudoproteus]|nr:protein YohO [Shimwellia pseudoproteus]MBJ3815410.1 protein YohO [Shimwellia pseudoproteus]